MSESPTSRRWPLLIISVLLSGCMALPFLIPPLVEFGANLLRTAVTNYGDTHEQNMENLLVALQQRTNPMMPQGIVANPYAQPGGVQQSGYFGQDYQTTQGYPASQGYPSSPNYSQQVYAPNQNQPPQYDGNTPYPSNQYPNQGQQGNPYPNNPAYANQQASVPGYSASPQNQYPQQGQQADAYPNNQNVYPNQNSYPNQAPYSNQAPYPNQPPYPGQGQPYPGPSYPMDQQGQPSPTPYGNTATPSVPAYPNQPIGTPEYQTTQSTTTQSAAAPISLDVLLVKKHLVNGVSSYLPIKDGDTLFDGRGNPQAGDKFRVMFRAKIDCYVYVIAVDGSAWAQGLFPSPSTPFANPVKAGQQHILPEGTNWFSLDQFKGIETIFVVASRARRPDIEQILTTITGRERSPAEKPQAVSEPAIIPNGYSGARPGSSPFAFQTSQHQQQELLPTTYFVKTAGEDLRITRWFRHQ